MAMNDLKLTVKLFFTELSDGTSQTYRSTLRYGVLAVGLIALGGLGYGGHGWYVAARERAAEKDFSSSVAQYHQAHNNPDDVAWDRLASLFEVGYAQHRSSTLAPYFLAFQSDALLQQKRYPEALEVLKKALDLLPQSSPFYDQLRLKYNLIILDMPEHPEHHHALQILQEIGADTTNPVFETALFYLGRYHFVHHNLEQARVFWQQLRATAVDENPSALIQAIDDYLQLIG